MSLTDSAREKFKLELQRAASELGSTDLKYTRAWIYELPGQALEINGEMLHVNYQIPTGFDGYGETDLDILEQEGFLIKQSDIDGDPDIFEKTILYTIVGSSNFKMNTSINTIIERDFTADDFEYVQLKIDEVLNATWNVGAEQLARSILFLAHGDVQKLASFFPIFDPRDLVMEADLSSADRSAYFN